MTVELQTNTLRKEEKLINIKVRGKLDKKDYEKLVPEIDRQIKEFGKINLLLELVDFEGWTVGAVWEDTKFGLRHFNDIERLAIIGDRIWEKGMAYFCKVFTTAKVRYFTKDQQKEAQAWVRGE